MLLLTFAIYISSEKGICHSLKVLIPSSFIWRVSKAKTQFNVKQVGKSAQEIYIVVPLKISLDISIYSNAKFPLVSLETKTSH